MVSSVKFYDAEICLVIEDLLHQGMKSLYL